MIAKTAAISELSITHHPAQPVHPVHSDAASSDTRPRQRIKPSTMCDWVKLVPPDRELFPQFADQTELK
jgi:hypothetical protein